MGRPLSAWEIARAQGQLWTPAAERGAISGWFDFSEPSSISWATGISQIRSRDDAAVLMEQGGGSAQPGFGEINGRRAASFGASNKLLLQFTSANSVMSNSFVVGLVASITSASGANSRIITWMQSASDYDSSTSVALLYRLSANTWATYQNNGARATTSGCTDGVPHVFVVESDGTTCRHYRNGVAGGSGNWGTISLGSGGRWAMGCYTSGGGATDLRGQVGEIVAIRGWRAGLADRLAGYLAHRWRRPLEGGPYALRPPLIGG